jgi:hypothetical protein
MSCTEDDHTSVPPVYPPSRAKAKASFVAPSQFLPMLSGKRMDVPCAAAPIGITDGTELPQAASAVKANALRSSSLSIPLPCRKSP